MTGEDSVALAIIGGFDGRGRLRRLESSADGWKLGGAAGIRQEAEVTDAAEPFRQHVEQEATDELINLERHHLGLVVGAIILPTEADATVLAGEEPTVGDRDAVGVAPQIFEDLLRATEGALGIDDPFDIAQQLEMPGEGRRFPEAYEIAEELQLAFVERRLQALQEQTPIQSRQNTDGEEEVGPAVDPASVGREAAARHNAVGMRMMRQGLAPGVENGDHTGLGAEVLWIGADDADRLGRGLEQNVIHDRLVLKGDGGDGGRHGEDDMEIGDRQQVGLTICKPLGARQALALWTVPVAAAVVGDADRAAVIALLDVTAEGCGAASLDRGHDAALVGQEPTALCGTERIAVVAEMSATSSAGHMVRYSEGITSSES
jgi:hypothetical protein